jgi:hypothetical protein
MINEYDYYCPSCDKKLSENNEVVFNVVRLNNSVLKIYLEPKPRSYKFRSEHSVSFKEKEVVDFCCPHCKTNLVSKKYPNFVKIILKVTHNVLFDVYFSRIHGDHRTYVGIEDFEEEYGDKIAI